MTEAKELQKGMYISYNNEIFKVTRKEVVACGTHSHSKTKLFVQPLFGGGEKPINLAHHDSVDVVDIIKKEGQVIAKMAGKVQLMDTRSYETMDADVDDGLLKEISEGDNVTFISFRGQTRVLEKR